MLDASLFYLLDEYSVQNSFTVYYIAIYTYTYL